MGDGVKVRKRLKISGVVVKSKDIRQLAERIYKEYIQDLERDQDSRVSVMFILYSSDGTQYESENTEFLSEEGILDTRRILSVEMNYYNYSEGKNISVDLSHHIDSSSSSINKVIVSSNDESWADGILKWIEDTISNWQKQKNWPYRYGWLLAAAIGIGVSLLLYSILDIVFSQLNPEKARGASAIISEFSQEL